MRYRPPELRRADFGDAFVPRRLQWAVAEASRCLLCDAPPCEEGCPAGVGIKRFIRSLRSRNVRSAAGIIRESNFLVATCGRICPQEASCEKRCSAVGLAQPIAIGELQRFVGEAAIRENVPFSFPEVRSRGEVAVVGAGPAGLSAAFYLRREGVVADLYERREHAGGVPMTGIPRFRLPREVLRAELAFLEQGGIRVIREDVRDFERLAGGRRAVFLGCGLDASPGLGVPGEDLRGVFQAADVLERASLGAEPPRFEGTTVVIGGGNTALDAATSALRLGSTRVIVAYRRTESEMPAWAHHRAFAGEEGVEWRFLLLPVALVGDAGGHVVAARFQQACLGGIDRSGRPEPVPIAGAFVDVECRQVVPALGNRSSGWWRGLGLEAGEKGPWVDPSTMETSRAGVFAGGDLVRGGATVVQAVADGRRAAAAMARRVPG